MHRSQPALRSSAAPRNDSASFPTVTVIVVCRNEHRHIRACLDSVLANNYPRERLQVLVVDGMSTDGTREILADYARRCPAVEVVDNPRGAIPAAMNVGLRHARGQIIMKMDAHASCPSYYVSRCVQHLLDYGADNVGGVCRVLPGADTVVAMAIGAVLSHPFGSGNAYVKVGAKRPRWVDTVAFGCYRREVFAQVGQWNEMLAGSSDLDMNARLRAAGGRILLVPDIIIDYYADRDLAAFWRHNFADGVWATYVLKFGSRAWSWRHWVPLGFVLMLAATGGVAVFDVSVIPLAGFVAAYAGTTLAAASHLAMSRWNGKLLWAAPLTFAVRHMAHGLGAAYGLILLALPGVRWRGRRGSLG